MDSRLRTVLCGAAMMGLLAACNPMGNPPSAGTRASTMTAPARAGAPPAGTTASGENAQVNQTTGAPGGINRPYNLGADPNFPGGGSGLGGKPSGTGP